MIVAVAASVVPNGVDLWNIRARIGAQTWVTQTKHPPGDKDHNKRGGYRGRSGRGGRGGLFTPTGANKRGANAISPLDGVLPKTRSMAERGGRRAVSSLNQLLEPIDLQGDRIGELTVKL